MSQDISMAKLGDLFSYYEVIVSLFPYFWLIVTCSKTQSLDFETSK